MDRHSRVLALYLPTSRHFTDVPRSRPCAVLVLRGHHVTDFVAVAFLLLAPDQSSAAVQECWGRVLHNYEAFEGGGYLFVASDAVINPCQLASFPPNRIWYAYFRIQRLRGF